MSPSPYQQALAAAIEENNDALAYVVAKNKSLISDYAIKIQVWIASQVGPGPVSAAPVPDPAHKWDTRVEAVIDSAQQEFYAKYPGIPQPLEAFETGEPVCAKYVPQASPEIPQGPIIGARNWGNWFNAGYVDQTTHVIVTDATPAGVVLTGTSHDGVTGRFTKFEGAGSPGWWLLG